MVPLDSPQPTYPLPPLKDIPDDWEDKPQIGRYPQPIGTLGLPELVFGAGALSQQYNGETFLSSDAPFRALRLALRYGITAIDTSPYYGASEIVLGSILSSEPIRQEFPRSSYKLITKVGRYGPRKSDFDYSPETIRKSILRSLERLKTDYLDAVFLHDVEFVCSPVYPLPRSCDFARALEGGEESIEWGLVDDKCGKIWGTGDQKIVDALGALRKLKEEGMVKAIGISGYPLTTLLRLARLAKHIPPEQPLDILMSYSHYNLHNTRFLDYLPHFQKVAGTVLTASPFSMGFLTPNPPPWHPAPLKMMNTKKQAEELCKDWPGGLPNLALGFALRRTGAAAALIQAPSVVGLSNIDEVHETMRVWREVNGPGGVSAERKRKEDEVRATFWEGGWENWSWSSPPSPPVDILARNQLGEPIL